jgi:nicotinamidase-related amidase
MPDPLLVVDVQRCFLNEFTHHIPARIVQLVQRGTYTPVFFTCFINTPDSPYRRLLNWHECEREPDTALAPELLEYAAPERVFQKHGVTGLPEKLAASLKAQQVERVAVAGIGTDMCVLKVAMDLFDLGIEPFVLVDCCASTAGAQAHLAGLAVLSRNIGPHQLIDAGLGDGRFAAAPELWRIERPRP